MKHPTAPLMVLCAALLSACGGGGDDAPPPATTLSGSVVKGPVVGANVCAYKLAATGKGEQLACTTSGASGAYAISLQYAGEVVVEATGGSYTDEATGAATTLGTPLQVVASLQGGSATAVVTPLTSVAYSIARGAGGGLSAASFASAAASVASQFQLGSVNIATATPVVSGGGIDLYGRMLRAVSQYIANGGSLAAFVGWSSPASFQAAFGSAYATINGSSISFTFGTGTGTGGTGGSTRNLVIQVSVSGAPASTINVGNVPVPATQAEFCGGIQSDTSFQQISQGASGTLTINSCSFSGSTGTVQATLSITSPIALTVPYAITYSYQ